MMFWMRRPRRQNVLGLVLFLAISYIGIQLITTVLSFLPSIGDQWRFAAQPLPYLSPLLTTIFLTTYFDRMPLAWSGFGLHRWMGREIAWGIAFGLAMVTIAWLPVALAGSVEPGRITAYFLPMVLIMLANAAGEEIVFRGYPFQRVVELTGPAVGTVLLSASFAAAHLGNPNVSGIAVANTFLVGILFSACRLATGSLWLPIALHATWNIALAFLFGLPMSGIETGTSLLHTLAAGPNYLTGGPFGPEGSIITTFVLLLASAAFFRLPASNFSPYIFSRIFWGTYRQKLRKFGTDKGMENSSHIRSVS